MHDFRHSNSPRGKTYTRLKELSSRHGRLFSRVNPAYTSQYPAEVIARKYKENLRDSGKIGGTSWHLDATKGVRRTSAKPKSPIQKTGEWFHHPDIKKPVNADVNAARNIALKRFYHRVRNEAKKLQERTSGACRSAS